MLENNYGNIEQLLLKDSDELTIKELQNINKEYRKMLSAIEYMEYRIDLSERDFMFQRVEVPNYNEYRPWNRLRKKIINV